jgi:Uma2 family endonuclease
MSTDTEFEFLTKRHPIKKDEPTWDLALLFPNQGHWTEAEYLALDTNWLVELADGCLEVLPMPTIFHQLIVQFLLKALEQHVATSASGLVLMAPLRVRLWPGRIREPDIVYLRPERVRDYHKPPDGADLVMEVVSPTLKGRERDLQIKPDDYARAGIAEYWIVDPQERRITVLALDGTAYRVHGEFAPGTRATSVLLPGFAVDVTAAFAAGEAHDTTHHPKEGHP